jgi:hypothetical protein
MTKLIIKNIGPIKDIDINLNKVNVIIGPQSSGKSTINKIACYCAWVEKKISLDQSFEYFLKDDNFLNNLIRFHKFESYLREGSQIIFESDIIKITYNHPEKVPTFNWVDQSKYKRSKLSYIPAERNIISMISDWKEVTLPDNNIRNFMSDWNIARKVHKIESSVNISSLNIKYYYNEERDIDYITNSDGSRTPLMSASSGIQSYVPLHILADYFTDWIYKNPEPKSVSSNEKNLEIFERIQNEILSAFQISPTLVDEILLKGKSNLNQNEERIFSKLIEKYQCYMTTNSTKLYIEEPELNLFPSVQKEVLYYLIHSIQKRTDDTITITTHSPYILYALNNCLMGWLIKDNVPGEIAQSLESHNSWIDPSLVSVWQIKDGGVVSIREQHTNTIGKHYFNEVMNETMNEYYTMLNYLKFD